MKLYKTTKYNLTIQEIEATRVTESSYYSINSRGKEEISRLSNSYNDHFETFEGAKQHIIAREAKRVQWAKNALEQAEIEYQRALLIEQP